MLHLLYTLEPGTNTTVEASLAAGLTWPRLMMNATFSPPAALFTEDEADPELMFQDYEGFPGNMASECHINWAYVEGFRQGAG